MPFQALFLIEKYADIRNCLCDSVHYAEDFSVLQVCLVVKYKKIKNFGLLSVGIIGCNKLNLKSIEV